MTPDEMISEILNPDIEDREGLANDLLVEFSRGYPIENLKSLINSELLSAQSTASFIATELWLKSAPLLEDLAKLLNHPTARTRYDTLETLWKCATYKDGWAIAAVLRHLEDPWPGVRHGAIDAIRLADRKALLSGFNHLKAEYPKTSYAKFGKAFLMAERGNNEVLKSLLTDNDPVARRFAVGLAARPRLVVDDSRLQLAMESSDAEITKYADAAKSHVLPPWSSLQ